MMFIELTELWNGQPQRRFVNVNCISQIYEIKGATIVCLTSYDNNEKKYDYIVATQDYDEIKYLIGEVING